MQDVFLSYAELTDDSGRLRQYEYYMTVDETEVNGFRCESYGVRVAEHGGEEAEVRGVTCSMARIYQLADLLLRNAVTPVTLADVVSDQLAQDKMASASRSAV